MRRITSLIYPWVGTAFVVHGRADHLKSLAEVQKMKDKMRVHWKIVETGWKYK